MNNNQLMMIVISFVLIFGVIIVLVFNKNNEQPQYIITPPIVEDNTTIDNEEPLIDAITDYTIYLYTGDDGTTGDAVLRVNFSSEDFEKLNNFEVVALLYDDNKGEVITLNRYVSDVIFSDTLVYSLPDNFVKTGYPTTELYYNYYFELKLIGDGVEYLSEKYVVHASLSSEDDKYYITYLKIKLNL